MFKCLDCGHIGDIQESTFCVEEKKFKFELLCSQCYSDNLKELGAKKDE